MRTWLLQVGRHAQRRPALQQARAAHRRHRDVQQLVDAETRVVAGAEADHDVGVLYRRTDHGVAGNGRVLARIDQAGAGVDAHVEIRVAADKPVQARRQPARRKRWRGAHRERALLLDAAHFRHRVAQAAESFAQLGQQHLPGARQFEPALQAPEQALAEIVLQALHLVADRRRRDVQFLGRHGEAQMARRSLERPQRVERRQAQRRRHIGLVFLSTIETKPQLLHCN